MRRLPYALIFQLGEAFKPTDQIWTL